MGEVRSPVRAIGIQWYYPEGQQGRKITFSVEISIDNTTSTFRQILSDKESSGYHSMEYYEFDQDYDARRIKLIVHGNSINEWASIVSINILNNVPPQLDQTLDRFGVQKTYPDAAQSRAVHQGEQGWTERYSEHGYYGIPGVTIWRKTFQFAKNGFLNQEATIYLNLPGLNSEYYDHRPEIGPCASGSGLSVKLRGGGHSDSGDGSARCYIIHFEYEGNNNCKNFQKEAPHPKYAKHTVPTEFEAQNWVNPNNWVGFKAVTINEGNGVRCEAYIDYGGIIDGRPANQWRKWYSILDAGQFGGPSKPNTIPPFRTTNGNVTQFRMDNADRDTKARFASVREIKSA